MSPAPSPYRYTDRTWSSVDLNISVFLIFGDLSPLRNWPYRSRRSEKTSSYGRFHLTYPSQNAPTVPLSRIFLASPIAHSLSRSRRLSRYTPSAELRDTVWISLSPMYPVDDLPDARIQGILAVLPRGPHRVKDQGVERDATKVVDGYVVPVPTLLKALPVCVVAGGCAPAISFTTSQSGSCTLCPAFALKTSPSASCRSCGAASSPGPLP